MRITPIECTNCGAAIDPENVSERLAIARCRHCKSVFSIEPSESQSAQKPMRPEVSLPDGFSLDESVSSLEIRHRWYSHLVWFFLFICIFWNGSMLVWHGMALGTGMWFMSLVGLLHTGVGIGFTYFVAAMFVNTTTIRVSHGTIDISFAPLPWIGAKNVDAADIRQLFCREKVQHGKNGSRTTYEVHIVDRNNHQNELLKGLQTPEQAMYVEQELERYLRIEDQAVKGEL